MYVDELPKFLAESAPPLLHLYAGVVRTHLVVLDTLTGFLDTLSEFLYTLTGLMETHNDFLDTLTGFLDTLRRYMWTIYVDSMCVRAAGFSRETCSAAAAPLRGSGEDGRVKLSTRFKLST